MMAQRNYAELVAQAEKAVASVKDPELKRAAFEKVLDDLLSASARTPVETEARAARKRSETRGAPKRSRPRL